jgi:HSP20 family molecular chaperone IbpA
MSLLNSILPTLNRKPASGTEPAVADHVAAIKPVFEIKETAEAYGVTVQLPGVVKDGLELTVEDGLVRVLGRRSWQPPADWTALYRETADAAYELVLTHDNLINADKVAAELRDGVLRLSLPKTEALKPRKITVN